MKRHTTAFTFASAVMLTACGGGGGASNTTAPVNPIPPVVVDNNALQLSVPPATYGSGSSVLSAFNALNAARQTYGVGLLAQQAKLDTSATNHATYVSQRWGAKDFANVGHSEEASKPGFTGATPADRIANVAYSAASTSEVLTTFISVDGVSSDPGAVAVEYLLSAPYHRFSLFEGNRDVGISDASARFEGEGGTNHTVVLNMSVAQGNQPQLPAQSWVGVWPADNATEVMYSFAGESPNPIPALNGACGGYPVSVQVRSGITLNTTAFTLTEAGASAPVSVQLSTAATDVNPGQARSNTAYIIPFKPLKLGKKYTAHFTGSANGVAIDKSWSFTTTNANKKLIYGCDPA